MTAAELDANQVQVQRIVQSRAFRASELHRNLLSYLAEKSLSGEAESLKEYTVGLDVFGKPASYDPRQESVVRMHVGRLRQKIAEYYRTEGQQDPVLVDLPKGGFALTFETRSAGETATAPASAGMTGMSRREAMLVVALLLAVASAAYFAVRFSRATPPAGPASQSDGVPAMPASWTPELQELWAPLLSSDRPLMVTVAIDPFHPDTATSSGTANAAFLLGQFLGQRKHNVFPIRSDLLTMGEIAMGDIIWVGPTAGKPQIQAIPPVAQPFVLTAGGVRNLAPVAGEPEVLEDTGPNRGSQDFDESYALISHLPGLGGNGEILYLQANTVGGVVGAVQALTDTERARVLVGYLKGATGRIPRYYQVVLRVKAMDDTPVDIIYVVHRELSAVRSSRAAQTRR